MAKRRITANKRADEVNAAERRAFVVRLAKRGLTYRDIAAATLLAIEQGQVNFTVWDTYDERDAWKDIDTELRRIISEVSHDTKELRALELERINTALSRIWGRLEKDSDWKAQDAAISSFIRLSERRSKLLGLDAPTKLAQTDTDGNDVQPKLYVTFNPDDWPGKEQPDGDQG